MTLKQVLAAVARVAKASNDPEQAHGLEDHLYHDLLDAIARGTCKEPANCAAVALQTKGFFFPRWYA